MSHARQAVLFDLYGTLVELLVDETSPAVWDGIAAEFFGRSGTPSGAEVRAAYARLHRQHLHDRDVGFLLDAVFPDLLTTFGVAPAPETVARFAETFRRHSTVRLEKKPYTDRLLAGLRGHYKLALVSNTEALVTRYDLRVLGLGAAFDEVTLSSDTGARKPQPEIFDETLARLGAAAESGVYVGNDFDDDVVGALNSGLDVVYLTGEPPDVCGHIERRYFGHVRCAGFSHEAIAGALNSLGFTVGS